VILASVWALLKYCLIKNYSIMENVSKHSKISLKEAEANYQSSRENYSIEGAESHLAYYREKYPEHYTVLIKNIAV